MNDETLEQKLTTTFYTLPKLDCERSWRIARANCQFYRDAHNINEGAIMMNVEKFFRLKLDAHLREARNYVFHTYSRYCLNGHVDMNDLRFTDATPSLIAFVLIARHCIRKRHPPISMTIILHNVPETVQSRHAACFHAMMIMINHVQRMRAASRLSVDDADADAEEIEESEDACSYTGTTLMIGENTFHFRPDFPHAVEN